SSSPTSLDGSPPSGRDGNYPYRYNSQGKISVGYNGFKKTLRVFLDPPDQSSDLIQQKNAKS
ncbi:Uncharacterized protein APZ42_000080, partial [Daphnia magna]